MPGLARSPRVRALATCAGAVLVAASAGGCGFVLGVDFFDLEGEATAPALDGGEGGALPALDGGAADAPSTNDASACTSAAGCASFDDCAPLAAENRRDTAGAVLDVTEARAYSPPCSVHAALPFAKDTTKRSSAYRTRRASPQMVRTTLDFWFWLERIDAAPDAGATADGRTQIALLSFVLPAGSGAPSRQVRTLLAIGRTNAYLTGDDGSTSVALAETSSAGLVGGSRWHHVVYEVERTSSSTRARFDAKVTIDDVPYLAGDVSTALFDTTSSIEAQVGVVESTSRTAAPSVFIDDVRVVTVPPS